MTPRCTRSIVAGQRGAARRLGEDAFGFREQTNRVDDLRVGDRRAGAAGGPHRLHHLVAVGRIADRDRLRDRVRAAPARDIRRRSRIALTTGEHPAACAA